MKEELADVLAYSLQLATKLHLDIKTIVEDKMEKNAKKYPVEKSKGRADKYDKLWDFVFALQTEFFLQL